MKTCALTAFLLLTLTSCCKEDPPVVTEHPLPVGSWDIVEVDSGYIVYGFNQFNSHGPMGLTGQLVFNEDGRGKLSGDADLISCTFNDFTWVHNDSLNNLYLIFRDRLSKGIIEKMSKDTLVFDFQDWCRAGQSTGAEVFYRIIAVK